MIMQKQIGRIYCRDQNKSPDLHLAARPNKEQIITVRREPNSNQLSSYQYSKNKKNEDTLRNNVENRFKSTSQKSEPFSSIKHSSIVSVDEYERLTQSIASKKSETFNYRQYQEGDKLEKSFGNKQEINNSCLAESLFADSLAIYQNPLLKNNLVVKKLSHINNIFRELKILRDQKLKKNIVDQINETERELIQIERDILRNC